MRSSAYFEVLTVYVTFKYGDFQKASRISLRDKQKLKCKVDVCMFIDFAANHSLAISYSRIYFIILRQKRSRF